MTSFVDNMGHQLIPIVTQHGSEKAMHRFSERVCDLCAGVRARTWAVRGVANPRHSYGYGCGLRLAVHPNPHPARLAPRSQTRSQAGINRRILEMLNNMPMASPSVAIAVPP